MLVSLYIGMTLYTEGIEGAFGGAFAPVESQNQREAPLTTHLTPGELAPDARSDGSENVWITDHVRQKVSADYESGARRRGY
jgi:hypothetical protein